MNFRSLFLLGAMVVATSAAAQTQPRTKAKVGVNTKNPTENLHVNGTLRVQNLPANGATNAIGTKPDGSASTTNDQTFMPKYIVTADANGVLGRSSGADPDFFYMPAICLPLKSGDEQSNTGYSRYAGGGQFEVELRTILTHQFGLRTDTRMPAVVKSNPSAQISNITLKGHVGGVDQDFDYFVTYYDPDVFEDVQVWTGGTLHYKVKDGAVPTAKTYMNIVVKRK